ncbi:MAG: helix-turn-helix domain-containing protein [Anaerolineae bacterium]|nr:helix-turn-helix domain-containing protein [Anaerolineae bacterium]
MTDNKMWLTPQNAAEELGVHIETIRRLLRIGAIKGIKLGKSSKAHWRIYRIDFDDWKNNQYFSRVVEENMNHKSV